jgi:hypothetical protein
MEPFWMATFAYCRASPVTVVTIETWELRIKVRTSGAAAVAVGAFAMDTL